MLKYAKGQPTPININLLGAQATFYYHYPHDTNL